MLRQKLLLVLGSVVALMLAVGVLAVLLLQSVLNDLERVSNETIAGASSAIAAQLRLADIQAEIERARTTSDRLNIEMLRDAQQVVTNEIANLKALEIVSDAVRTEYDGLQQVVGNMSQAIERLPQEFSTADTDVARGIQKAAAETHQRLAAIHERMAAHTETEQQRATARFRWVALGLGLAFVVVINASIMVLSRMAGMILRPVDRLVDASRRLACEDFAYRIDMDQRDEFGELARAYNSLAAQLQANEERKIETLHQVARTLNHELNNAIAVIQLQLDLSAKRSGSDELQSERLREIQRAMSRMAGTVSALTRVRRIVLTDYLSGVKMLDLEASAADEPPTTSTTSGNLVPLAHALRT